MNVGLSENLKKAWKKRKSYLGPDKKTSLYTTWRARVFTAKGKKAGFPKAWESFQGFKKEMIEGWEEGRKGRSLFDATLNYLFQKIIVNGLIRDWNASIV